jgi:deoxyxylulose-5-phosphate synthase
MRLILKSNDRLRVFSPAMFASSGFGPLRAEFPEQFIDTGINEPHTVTSAAGMALLVDELGYTSTVPFYSVPWTKSFTI